MRRAMAVVALLAASAQGRLDFEGDDKTTISMSHAYRVGEDDHVVDIILTSGYLVDGEGEDASYDFRMAFTIKTGPSADKQNIGGAFGLQDDATNLVLQVGQAIVLLKTFDPQPHFFMVLRVEATIKETATQDEEANKTAMEINLDDIDADDIFFTYFNKPGNKQGNDPHEPVSGAVLDDNGDEVVGFLTIIDREIKERELSLLLKPTPGQTNVSFEADSYIRGVLMGFDKRVDFPGHRSREMLKI